MRHAAVARTLFVLTAGMLGACGSESNDVAPSSDAGSSDASEPAPCRKAPLEDDWFHDAKVGVMVHWGPYSVPGWAETKIRATEGFGLDTDWEQWFLHNPYAEWYENSLLVEGSGTQQHHAATYGELAYDDFAPMFHAAAKGWDASAWAELFARAGARYVVLVTKHHDGYLLWPSDVEHPNGATVRAERDLVGELAAAVRARTLHMGLYYSGGLDWTFEHEPIVDLGSLLGAAPRGDEYARYAVDHWKELIDRYEPDVMWNDLGFPSGADRDELFAYYRKRVPRGRINDRFTLPAANHCDFDFLTLEYDAAKDVLAQKWETVRGFGQSFGYNQNESEADRLSVEEIIHTVIDTVAKNGNVLFNVGPKADGTIPEDQRVRLEALGAWLDVNGEGIYATRAVDDEVPAQTGDGIPLRFTQKAATLYAHLLGTPAAGKLELGAVPMEGNVEVQLLGREDALEATRAGDALTVTWPADAAESAAYTLAIRSTQ